MALVPLENAGRAGIITDQPAHDLPLEAWSGGSNVIFRDNSVRKAPGQQTIYTDYGLFTTPTFKEHFVPSGVLDGDYSSRVSTNQTGSLVVVGIPRKATPNGAYAGMAYVYEVENGLTVREIELIPSLTAPYGFFGGSVLISKDGSTIFVGQANFLYGVVHVFHKTGEHTWEETATIQPTVSAGTREPLYFGVTFDCNYEGTKLIVGCPAEEVNNVVAAGAVYIYDYASEAWSETQRILEATPATSHYFGSCVCMSDDGRRAFAGGRETVSNPEGQVFTIIPTVDAYGNFTWPTTPSATLTATDGELGWGFGYDTVPFTVGAETDFRSYNIITTSGKGERLFIGAYHADISIFANGMFDFTDTSRDGEFTSVGTATHASSGGSLRITGTDIVVGTNYVKVDVTLRYNNSYQLMYDLIQGLTSNAMTIEVYNPFTASYTTLVSTTTDQIGYITSFSITQASVHEDVATHLRFGLANGGGSDYFDLDNFNIRSYAAGKVYVFDDNGSGIYTEDEHFEPPASVITSYAYMGASLSCNEAGTVVAIGYSGATNSASDLIHQGAVILAYGELAGTMAITNTLEEETPAASRYWGYDVAMANDGSYLFISEFGDSTGSGPGTGGQARTHTYEIGDYEITIEPHYLLPWRTTSEIRWVYANDEKIYMTNGDTHTDITRYTTTPGDDDYNGATRPLWTGGVLNGIPIMNHDNGTDYPQEWYNTNSRMRDLTNWPANVYCKVLRVYKNFLIAMDVTTSGNRNPYEIRWSSAAEAGAVPATWDYTDETNNAGRNILSEAQNTGGFLIDCLDLGDQNIVYKGDAIYAMQLTTGDRTFIFPKRSGEAGLIAPGCVRKFFGSHFVVGYNDVYIFDGYKPQSIIKGKYRRWLYNNISRDYVQYTLVVPNYRTQEMMIAFVEEGRTSNYLSKALIWNWDYNTWTVKDLPDIAYMENGLAAGADVTFDDLIGTFEDQDYPMGGDTITPATTEILLAKAYEEKQLIRLNEGFTDRGENYVSYLERTGLAIVGVDQNGQAKVNPAVRKKVSAFYPKFYSDTNPVIYIYIGQQESPNGAILWHGPEIFTVGVDEKINVDVNTKYIGLRMFDQGNEEWIYSGGFLDVEPVSGV